MSALIPFDNGEDFVHVLIIGVAEYGAASQARALRDLPGLVKSVERAAKFWCSADHVLRGRKIGSVDVLLSCSSGSTTLRDTDGNPPEPATIANVTAAFDAWRGRCASSPGSLAIVHWLGHGAAEMARSRHGNAAVNLYCSDFDDVEGCQNGISLSETMYSLERIRFAKNVVCFIDACRAEPSRSNQREYQSALRTAISNSPREVPIVFSLQYDNAETFCRADDLPECGFFGGSVITEAVLDALEYFAWSSGSDQLGPVASFPVFPAGIEDAINRRIEWWRPFLGLPSDLRVSAESRKELLVCVQQAPRAMVELVVNPTRKLPVGAALLSSDPDGCDHVSGRSASKVVPMVLRGRSFRAEVEIGGWCAAPVSTGVGPNKHRHARVAERFFRDPDWRP